MQPGSSQQKRFLNWMTWDALRAQYQQWCDAHDLEETHRAKRTLFEKIGKEWSKVLGFRKIGQHARCLANIYGLLGVRAGSDVLCVAHVMVFHAGYLVYVFVNFNKIRQFSIPSPKGLNNH